MPGQTLPDFSLQQSKQWGLGCRSQCTRWLLSGSPPSPSPRRWTTSWSVWPTALSVRSGTRTLLISNRVSSHSDAEGSQDTVIQFYSSRLSDSWPPYSVRQIRSSRSWAPSASRSLTGPSGCRPEWPPSKWMWITLIPGNRKYVSTIR